MTEASIAREAILNLTSRTDRMVTEQFIQTINEQLFADESLNVYAVLDGASIPNLLDQLYKLDPEYACLYRGTLAPDMAQVAPYLVQLDDEPEFTEWLIQEGWGNHWGIFALSEFDLRTMRKHFRSLLTVHDPDGKPMLFRFYDPRVLRVYLPTCTEEELVVIFGPNDAYLFELENSRGIVRCQTESNSLTQKTIAVSP